MVDAVNTVHFVHNCKDSECIGGNHDLRNDLYIKNIFFQSHIIYCYNYFTNTLLIVYKFENTSFTNIY